MSELGNLLLLFAMGIPGWLVFKKLKMPGAPILGSMLAVGIFQVLNMGPGSMPAAFKPVLQVVVGLFIGMRVRPDTRQQLRGMIPVAALVSAWWLAVAFGGGYLLYLTTQLNLKTALLGSTPGGISEMSLLALHFGADAPAVALLQFFRVTLVLIGVPLAAPRLYPFLERLARVGRSHGSRAVASGGNGGGGAFAVVGDGAGGAAPAGAGRVKATSQTVGERQCSESTFLIYSRTVLAAAAGGIALEAIGFPAVGLVGSMLAVGVLRAYGFACGTYNEDLRCLAQVGLGGLIGLSFTSAVLQSLVAMIIPVAMLTTMMLSFGFLLAVLVHRLTGWDIRTCVLATCAGGLTQIGAVSEELGANPVTVTILHVVRLISIVAVLPPAFAYLLSR